MLYIYIYDYICKYIQIFTLIDLILELLDVLLRFCSIFTMLCKTRRQTSCWLRYAAEISFRLLPRHRFIDVFQTWNSCFYFVNKNRNLGAGCLAPSWQHVQSTKLLALKGRCKSAAIVALPKSEEFATSYYFQSICQLLTSNANSLRRFESTSKPKQSSLLASQGQHSATGYRLEGPQSTDFLRLFAQKIQI